MKKLLCAVLALLTLCLPLALTSCGGEEVAVLNVYNWGEYISDGSEDSLDVNAAFEEYYFETFGKKVKVNYTTYASNEDMYNKIKAGATSYDVIIPSDYMIEKMIAENMLVPLDFSRIPGFENIEDQYKNVYYDPENLYSVPYNVGKIGVIYNCDMVEEDDPDIGSWDLMWSEKYSGKILQFNNPRDAFGTAMYRAGIDANTTDVDEWRIGLESLKEQKPLIQSYVMDEIFNKMKNGSAAISSYYAGDFLSMYDSNDSLCFYYPEEGSNIFIDAMCIPTCVKNKEIAEEYINFMLSEEVAIANAEYIMYASPNKLVIENEEYQEYLEEYHDDAVQILYGDYGDLLFTYYHNLDDDTQAAVNEMWEELKIESSIEPWIHAVSAIILAALIAAAVYGEVRKHRRAKYYTKQS